MTWWHDAVVYQVYPRSFADGDGDGTGDLRGIIEHLDHLAWLGVDALWIGPCFASPQVDHGYDVSDYRAIDPLFGDLDDLDDLIAQAHVRGLKVTLDLVPNHTSDQHAWFRAALAAGPGSPERARYLFREGRGPDGAEPPTSWGSVFGGPSWTRVTEPDGRPGQWYYHLFAPEQPDLAWRNPEVLAEFCSVLRFWLDRGVDGFRVDVADALIKDESWPDTDDGHPVILKDEDSPVHGIYRTLRSVLDEYDGDRMAVVETGAPDGIVALFVRPDEMHLAFSFRYLLAGWDADRLRAAIEDTLVATEGAGAPASWVLDNHDTLRSVTRLGLDPVPRGACAPSRAGRPAAPDLAAGTRRSRALTLLMLALPGAVFLYNGQELGLPSVDDLPDEALQDPVFRRSGGADRGRDGGRVPMPWSGDVPPFGFSPPGIPTWLPMPPGWGELTVDAQRADRGSMLHLVRAALAVRRASPALGSGNLAWVSNEVSGLRPGLLQLDVVAGQETIRVVLNLTVENVTLPAGELLLASADVVDRMLPGEAAAWLRRDR